MARSRVPAPDFRFPRWEAASTLFWLVAVALAGFELPLLALLIHLLAIGRPGPLPLVAVLSAGPPLCLGVVLVRFRHPRVRPYDARPRYLRPVRTKPSGPPGPEDGGRP